MIAMMLPRPYIPLDSRLRENDWGLGVGIPLAPLRFAKGGDEHPPSPLTLCEGGRFLAAFGMTWCECEGGRF